MKAVGIDSTTKRLALLEAALPVLGPTDVLVKTLKVGICATDRTMVRTGNIYTIPAGEPHLILGHEGVGEVVAVGSQISHLSVGDVVVPIVYRDCGMQESRCREDMCPYEKTTVRGINNHGYFSEYFVESEEYLVKVPPGLADVAMLLEPLTVSLKGFKEASQLRERWLARPCYYRPADHREKVLIIGAGPIGMLGVFVARLRDYDTYVVDIVDEASRKAEIIRRIGATYINAREFSPAQIKERLGEFDIIAEAVEIPDVLFDYLPLLGVNGVFLVIGWTGGSKEKTIDAATLIRDMIVKQQAILATVGANRDHYLEGIEDMAAIKERFGDALDQVVTEVYPFQDFEAAFAAAGPDQIKVLLSFANAG